jgi:hypothetical protein
MYTGFCILSILWKQIEENIDVHVYWVLYSQYSLETDRRKHRCTFPENTENTEPSIHVHLCFLLSVSREYWEYRTQYTCTSIFSSICFQRILRIQNHILWKQKEENIDVPVHVYLVLYSQFSLETERRKHRCTCIMGSVLSVVYGNRKKKT